MRSRLSDLKSTNPGSENWQNWHLKRTGLKFLSDLWEFEAFEVG